MTTALNIPIVDPMLVRQFTPGPASEMFGGVIVFLDYRIEDVGLAESRLDYDEHVVDCSNRMFQITTELMCCIGDHAWTVFPSRRWRNLREGMNITAWPNPDRPLLFIGNPIRVLKRNGGIEVYRSSEYSIRSGVALQAERG